VSRENFADFAARGGSGVNGSFDGANFAAHDRCDQAGVDLFPADQHDIGGLNRRISRFNHRDQAATFDHSQSFSFHIGFTAAA
jgi:hypothetical protein